MKRLSLIVALVCLAGGTAFPINAVDRVDSATNVFEDIMASPGGGIPQELLQSARCIVILPSIQGAGVVFGDRYGFGVSLCRNETGWTAPSAIRIEGGDFGRQIIRGTTDLVLLVMSESAAYRLIKSPLVLGAGGTILPGPVGRGVLADPDLLLCENADVVYYGRVDGIYNDIAVTGAILRPVDDMNQALYGNRVSQSDILTGRISVPPRAESIVRSVTRYTNEAVAY